MEEEQQAQMPDNDQNGQQYSEAAAAEGGEEMEGQETSEMGGDGDSPDDDDKKLFVGGLSWETTQKDLKEYFQKFGEVASCTLKTDVETRRSRGFGFVVFAEATTVDKVLEEKVHKLHGRQIDPKKANPRGKEPQKKIYVGKVNPTTTEETIREYFEKYGKVTKIELPFNRNEDKRRDFVFVEFDLEETVQKVLGSHKIDETDCEVKVATPNTNNRGRGRGMGFWRGGDRGRGRGRGGYGGGWNDYGGDYYGYGQGGYGGYGGYNNNYYDQNYYQGYGNQGWGGYDNSYYNNYYGGGGGGGYDQYWNQGQQNTNYGKAQKRGGGGHSGYRPY